jgi:hypothetical protein
MRELCVASANWGTAAVVYLFVGVVIARLLGGT